MNTSKTSASFRIAAAAVMVGTFGFATAAHAADAKSTVDAKIVNAKAQDNVDAKAPQQKAKLPRKWVWKKYTKNFDSMFRK